LEGSPVINLKELSDDALVQLIADASAELYWRRMTSKPVGSVRPIGWVEEIKRSLKGGESIA
jgi:hypothetical protein